MAPKSFFVLFLLAWKVDFIGCPSTGFIGCDQAKYSNTLLTNYVDRCMLKNGYGWDPFFNLVPGEVWNALDKNLKEAGQKIVNNKQDAIEPHMPLIFQALKLVQPVNIKVVILGQDPTPQPDEASGMAFSVKNPRKVPSVLNVLLEVAFEGFPINLDKAHLLEWAKQGVLLLNTAFTCPHMGNGHFDMWKEFTKTLISYISEEAQPSVWLLWGTKAKEFKHIIEGKNKKHLVIEGGHPSPMGNALHGDSFFGGSYFICANQFLKSNRHTEINWSLSDTGHNALKQCPQYLQQQQDLIQKHLDQNQKLQQQQKQVLELSQLPHQKELLLKHQQELQQQQQIQGQEMELLENEQQQQFQLLQIHSLEKQLHSLQQHRHYLQQQLPPHQHY
ncbi:uracil-DNA glycosylase-like [Acropora muricata]|uniref:uracil-DNA glycosylase-like n=1 Tax=Acropora muricata TaxID=159855 RepID=UPI0034E45741